MTGFPGIKGIAGYPGPKGETGEPGIKGEKGGIGKTRNYIVIRNASGISSKLCNVYHFLY